MKRGFSTFMLLILVGVMVLTSCDLGAAPPDEPKAGRPIKVGILDCYSGAAAVFGDDALNGFKLALEKINQEGVLGTTIEYTTRDTKFEAETGMSAARELVELEQVDILVGTINSTVALQVSAYAREQKVPFIVWSAKSDQITGAQGHRYVFATGENTAMAGRAAGAALAGKPYITYWVAGDDYSYGHSMVDAAWNNLTALNPNVELIGESWWSVGEPDLIPYFTTMMAAAPDAVIFGAGGASMANVMKAIKATGMNEQMGIWIHTATDHAVLKPLGADAPEGVLGTMDYHFYYPDTPENNAFVEAFQAAYNYPPGFPAFHGYITAVMIAEAFRMAGSIDRELFVDALKGLEVASPAGGTVRIRECDNQIVLPIYVGVTGAVPQYDFLVATEIETIAGDEVMPSCDEIKAARTAYREGE